MHATGWRRGATAVVMAGIAACQGGAPVPESPTISAVVSASATPAPAPPPPPPPPQVAPPPVASLAVPTEARKIEIAGLRLADPVSGQRPAGAHPKGTVVALAYGVGGKDSVGLVELDVATGAETKRSKVTVEARARLVREGDAQSRSSAWQVRTYVFADRRKTRQT